MERVRDYNKVMKRIKYVEKNKVREIIFYLEEKLLAIGHPKKESDS